LSIPKAHAAVYTEPLPFGMVGSDTFDPRKRWADGGAFNGPFGMPCCCARRLFEAVVGRDVRGPK
jgi:hypothetical protein